MSRKLTDEEKKRIEPCLLVTWETIAWDVEDGLSAEEIAELACDADRPLMYGGISKEDDRALTEAYNHPDTQKWLKELFEPYA